MGASVDFYELLDGLLVQEVRLRMGVVGTEEIRTCRWLKDISWADIEARTAEVSKNTVSCHSLVLIAAFQPPLVPAAQAVSSWAIPQYENMLKQEFVPGLSLKEPPTALKYIGKDIPMR